MRNSTKIISAIVILAVLVIALVSFIPKQETSEPFKLSVNSWVGFGPFYLAQEKGFFKDEGLNVELSLMDGTAERESAMMANRIDAYGDTVDLLVLTKNMGVPSVAVMELDTSNGADGVLVKNTINSIQDLKGKSIAVQKNFVGESFLLYLLNKNNMSANDVQMIDTESGAAGAAFVSGQVDVAVTYEPWLSKAKERADGKVLVTSSDEPGVVVDILSVNEKALQNRPEDVKKLMRAWFRAVDYWRNNTDESNAIMAKHYSLNVTDFADMISGVKWPTYQENLEYFGTAQSPGRIYDVANIFTDVFLETNSISARPDLNKAISNVQLQGLYS